MELEIVKQNHVWSKSKNGRNSSKKFFRYVNSMKEVNRVKFVVNSVDDFNNYFITTCNQPKITPAISKGVYDHWYQQQTVFFNQVTEIEIANIITTLKNIKIC